MKAKKKQKRVSASHIIGQFANSPSSEETCWGNLTVESKEQAAKRDAIGQLDLLRDKLHCTDCDAKVSAKKDEKTGEFVLLRRPHRPYRKGPKALRKPEGGWKRSP